MAKRGASGRTRRPRSLGGIARLPLALLLAATVAGYSIHQFEQLERGDGLALSQVADAELEPRLRDLVVHGKVGLTSLVEAIDSERAALQAAAIRILHEEIDRLKTTADDDVASSIDQLAHLLANNAPQFHGEALAQAAELADRIIALPSKENAPGITRIRDCHRVLAAHTQSRIGSRNRSVANLAGSRAANDKVGGRNSMHPAGFAQSSAAIEVVPLAGGSLPIDPAQGKPLRLPEQVVASGRPIRANPIEPRTLPMAAASNAGQGNESTSAAAVSMIVEPNRPATSDSGMRVRQAQHSDNVPGEKWPASAAQRREPAVTPPEDLQRLLELDQRIRSNDAAIAAAARRETEQLRVDRRQLALARGAVDPDPQVRKEVVEALPLVGSVDARGWLLWLSHDSDTAVRRAAISLLATAGDGALKKRVRDAAMSDPDLQVREKARASGVR
jgi:HEAT repeats